MERPEHPKREIKQPETSVQPGLYIGVKKERKKNSTKNAIIIKWLHWSIGVVIARFDAVAGEEEAGPLILVLHGRRRITRSPILCLLCFVLACRFNKRLKVENLRWRPCFRAEQFGWLRLPAMEGLRRSHPSVPPNRLKSSTGCRTHSPVQLAIADELVFAWRVCYVTWVALHSLLVLFLTYQQQAATCKRTKLGLAGLPPKLFKSQYLNASSSWETMLGFGGGYLRVSDSDSVEIWLDKDTNRSISATIPQHGSGSRLCY